MPTLLNINSFHIMSMSNCIIYVRSARHNPVALNEQLYACTKTAKRRRMNIVAVFSDEGDKSEGLAKAIGMIATQKIDYLVIERADRISRNLYQSYCITNMVQAGTCRIIGVHQTRTLSQPLSQED